MKPYYLFVILFALNSCTTKSESKATIDQEVKQQSSDTIVITNRENYSSEYLKSLKDEDFPGSIILVDSLLINGPDTIPFPTILNLDSVYTFATKKKNINLKI
mgnify:CR=1 FL=1